MVDASRTRGASYPVMSDVSSNALEDSDFYLVDGTDNTKRLAFNLDGITTATTRTISVPDLDFTVGSGVGSRVPIVDTAGVFATPIVLTAADSGKVYLLDDAAGLDFTLPAIAAADVGIRYEFMVSVANTSNSYRLTAQAADLLIGHVLTFDVNAVYTAPQGLVSEPDGTDDLVMTLAAIAQGGGIGGWFDITAITATRWFIRGSLVGDGVIVTNFS